MGDLANIILRSKQDRREEEAHKVSQRIRKIGLGQLEREETAGLHEKEVQLKGATLDYENNEREIANTMQKGEQEIRALLQKGRRTEAEMGVAAVTEAKERQPDELTVARENLNTQVADIVQRQLSTFWNVARTGDKKTAIELYNKSKLLHPGQKASDMKLEDVETTDEKGKKVKVQVLTITPEGEGGKVRRIPVATLEAMRNKYGSRYEKSGNNIVRINPDGSATPVYEQDQYMTVPEGGSVVSKRTGQPPAGAGVAAGAGAPGARPPGADQATARVDARVTRGKAVVDRYLGISEFTGLDSKNQPRYAKIIERMGLKVRAGTDPEAAATAAINEVTHEEAALAAGGRPRGAGAYSGPAPWRR